MSFAAATPLPAAVPTPAPIPGAGAGGAASSATTSGQSNDAAASPFAGLIAQLQGDDASGAQANAAQTSPLSNAPANDPNAQVTLSANDMAMAAAMVSSALPSPELANDEAAKDDAQDTGKDEDNTAPLASGDADPNQTALIASLVAAQQVLPQPMTAAIKTADKSVPGKTLSDPAATAPVAPAPSTDGDDSGKTNAVPASGANAADFGKALAAANAQDVKTGPGGAQVQAKTSPAAAIQALTTAHAATRAADRESPVEASGFSVQPAAPATPVSYTAAAIQADAPAPAPVPAVQVPVSTMSQTAVQTLSALSVQIGKRVSDGNTKFNVELHPADLGRVDVALTIDRDGRVNAHLDFDTPMTAAAFSTHENELRQQLSQAGLNVDAGALTFTSRDADSQTTPTASAFSASMGNANMGDSSPNGSNGFNQNPQHPQPQPHTHDAIRALAAANIGAEDSDLSALSMLSGQGSTLALNLIV